MTTGDTTLTDGQLAHIAHTDLVKMVMASIDLVALVQRGEVSPDLPEVRKSIGKALRRSQILHATAIAGLMLDAAPDSPEHAARLEYAGQLVDDAGELDRYPDGDAKEAEHPLVERYGALAPFVVAAEQIDQEGGE